MIAAPQPKKMSVEEYLDWEPQQDVRYEYVNGEVFAMTGGTIPHNDIALNLYRAIYPHARSKGCRINVADVKVQISPSSPYYYPDIIISCDARDLNARKFIQYSKLIIEVLSPGTEGRDRGEKFVYYQSISTLQEYILVDSEKMTIERFRRGEGRMWLYYPYMTGEVITFESLEFSCPIELMYEDIRFDRESSESSTIS